jgi:hypothetical protein
VIVAAAAAVVVVVVVGLLDLENRQHDLSKRRNLMSK